MQPVEFYQIGGFRAHLREYSNKQDALAEKLMHMSRDGADLVLGIKPNGASYLLLPVDRFIHLKLDRPRGYPWKAYEFESLSPITFGAKLHLVNKLNLLASNKKSTGSEPRDRSKANTEYTAGGEGLSSTGVIRSSFEHQRLFLVFYRLCQGMIKHPADYAISSAPYFHNVRIYSFAFNLWAADTRPLDEREAKPRVLDVGWTEFRAPTDSDDLKAISTTHLFVEEDRFLGNPGKTRLAIPNVTQTMPRDSIADSIRTLFAAEENGERNAPKLLLVHDERLTRCVLRDFGVDTSNWMVGLKHLLYYPHEDSRSVDHRGDRSYDSMRGSRDYRGQPWSRERSRSPHRRAPDEYCVRPRTPPLRRAEAPPVYLVDVRQMYHYLMQVPTRNDTVPLNAKALSVRNTSLNRGEDDETVYEEVDTKVWCAGKDSRLLGYIWEDMANADAIDEQRELRRHFYKEDSATDRLRVPPVESHGHIEDEEVDPNDMIAPGQSVPPPPRPKPSNPIGFFDSEDEDDDW